MRKHKHVFTLIAPEPGCIDGDGMWKWCIKCGALKLGKETFLPGPRQKMVLLQEKK